MKYTLTLLPLILLLAACDSRSDKEALKQLPGVWNVEITYPDGSHFKSTTTVALGGSYVCKIVTQNETNGVRNGKLEGTFQVKDGFLIDTITKNSQTNASVPSTNRAQIVRVNSQELVVQYEGQNSESVFRRNIK